MRKINMKRRGRKPKVAQSSNDKSSDEENGVDEKPIDEEKDQEMEDHDDPKETDKAASDTEENGEPEEKKKKVETKKSPSKESKQKKKEEVKSPGAKSEKNGEPEEKKKVEKKKSSKKSKQKKKEVKLEEEEEEDGDSDEQYEVESILDEKMIKNVRHYLIRWKGYEPESDTWEPASTLNCDDLINKFKASREESSSEEEDNAKKRKESNSKEGKNKNKSKKNNKKAKKENKSSEDEWDENEKFEVDRIIEVHYKRNGGREYLVSWKGYPPADNSWEPEENLDCPELIAKFMAKVDKAREGDPKDLRIHRKPTERFTTTMGAKGHRASRRHSGKQRVQYHDAE